MERQGRPPIVLQLLLGLVALLQIFPLVWLVNFSFLKSGDFFWKRDFEMAEDL